MRANRQTSGSASQAPGPSHVLRDSMSHNIPTYVSNQMELGEVYNDEEDELDEFEENEDRAAVEAAQIARLRELERNSVSSLYALKGPSDPGMWCNTGGYNGISSFPPQLPNHHHHSMNMSHSSFVDHNDSMKNFKLNGNALFSKPYQIPNRSTQPMPHLSSHLSTSDHYFRMTLSDMARIGLPMPARVSSSHSGNASAMGHSSHKNPYHSNPSAIAAPQPQPQLQHQYPPHSTQADTSINTSTIDDTQEKEKIIYARIDMSKPATQKSPVSKPVVSTAPSRQYCDPALQVAPAFGFLMPYSHPPLNPSSQAANYPKMRLYSVNDDQGFYDKASAEGQSPEPSKSVLIESADARILKLHNWAKISDMPDYYCSTGIVTANDTSSATELQTRESLNEITPSATIELNREALGNESNNKRLRGLEPDSENGVLFSTSDSWVSEEPNQYEPVVTESSIGAVHNDYKCSNVTKKRSVR